MHGTAVTVTLNFDRLQTSCLGEGKEGVGDGLELSRERESGVRRLPRQPRHAISFHSRTDTCSNPTSLSLCQKKTKTKKNTHTHTQLLITLCVHACARTHTHTHTHTHVLFLPGHHQAVYHILNHMQSEVIALTVSAKNRSHASTT